MSGTQSNVSNSALPWLIFTLSGNAYAVNSEFVNGIEMKHTKITPIPDAPEEYCGMVDRRGEIYPIINMRKVFGFDTLEAENESYKMLIAEKKDEIKNWFEGMIGRAEDMENAENASLPQEAAQGREMLADFRSSSLAGAKIHKAEKVFDTLSELLSGAAAAKGESKEFFMIKVKNDCLPQIMKALDDAVTAHEKNFRETVVTISDGRHTLGLLVDQVLAVDTLISVTGSDRMRVLMKSKYFESVAKNDRIDPEILVINEEELLQFSRVKQ